MKEIAVMSFCSYDGMLSHGGVPMPFHEDTPFEMVVGLAFHFSHKYPRLGSEHDIFKHIIRGVHISALKCPKEFLDSIAPSVEEHLEGWRTLLKVFVAAYEGAGCIEWKAGIEHAKINPRKNYAIK